MFRNKKVKKNPHCPMAGCKTKQPHLSNLTTAGLHHAFSDPERCAQWTKHCIVELIQSVIEDVKEGRFFAYLTRWRQPDEIYYRALYLLFVADKNAIPHVVSDELPNSFSVMQKAVNHTVFGGKRELDKPLSGLSGEQFTVFDTLNSSAHASFATIVSCIEFAKKPEFRTPIIEKHLEYWKLSATISTRQKGCSGTEKREKKFSLSSGNCTANGDSRYSLMSSAVPRARVAVSQPQLVGNEFHGAEGSLGRGAAFFYPGRQTGAFRHNSGDSRCYLCHPELSDRPVTGKCPECISEAARGQSA